MKTAKQESNIKRNPIADCFKIFSVFVILVGFLLIAFYSLFMYKENGINVYLILNIVFYVLSVTILLFIFRAVAEIIQLLEDIKNK